MRERVYLSLVIGVLLCLAGWTTHAQLQRSNSAGRTWEYKVFDVNHTGPAYNEELNQYGAEGWELATTQGGIYTFKRPR